MPGLRSRSAPRPPPPARGRTGCACGHARVRTAGFKDSEGADSALSSPGPSSESATGRAASCRPSCASESPARRTRPSRRARAWPAGAPSFPPCTGAARAFHRGRARVAARKIPLRFSSSQHRPAPAGRPGRVDRIAYASPSPHNRPGEPPPSRQVVGSRRLKARALPGPRQLPARKPIRAVPVERLEGAGRTLRVVSPFGADRRHGFARPRQRSPRCCERARSAAGGSRADPFRRGEGCLAQLARHHPLVGACSWSVLWVTRGRSPFDEGGGVRSS